VRTALLSIDASLSFEQRIIEIELLVAQSAKEGARLALLPELSFCGYTTDTFAFSSHSFDDGLKFFSSLAKKYCIYIGFGSAKQKNTRYKNSYAIVSDSGKLICEYDKIHIFSFAKEDIVFDGGDSLCVFEIDGLSFGVSICYDLRFPEIYSLYADKCDAIICPSAWPKKRILDFKLLIKARALENRVNMLGINWQGGAEYVKSSLAINSKGLAQKPIISAEKYDIYDISKSNTAKSSPNSVLDKRLPLYAKLIAERL